MWLWITFESHWGRFCGRGNDFGFLWDHFAAFSEHFGTLLGHFGTLWADFGLQ